MAKAASTSFLKNLSRFLKKPWDITGPQSHPEYKSAVPAATEYRLRCPATPTDHKACIPAADPDNVFNITYHSRDQRRNRPPIRRTILRKADAERMMKEKKTFDPSEFPPVYLTTTVEEDYSARGGGYQ